MIDKICITKKKPTEKKCNQIDHNHQIESNRKSIARLQTNPNEKKKMKRKNRNKRRENKENIENRALSQMSTDHQHTTV